jgi:hypothetical protein
MSCLSCLGGVRIFTPSIAIPQTTLTPIFFAPRLNVPAAKQPSSSARHSPTFAHWNAVSLSAHQGFCATVVREFICPAVQISNLLIKGHILLWRIKGEYATLVSVDEGRKRVLLIAACILAARKLTQWDGRNSPASESAISDAIALAERIMAKIDSHWPVR